MKLALAALLAIAGCVDQPDVGGPSPSPAPKTGGDAARCGMAPQMPGWSYTVTPGVGSDSGYATLPERQWLDHVMWTEEIQSWSECMSH